MKEILWYIAAAVAVMAIVYVIDTYLDRKAREDEGDGLL